MTGEARDRIVAEARRLFYQFGFRRIAMDEIAANLRMSKKTLYALFPSKKELIQAVVESILEPNLARVSALARNEKSVAGFFSGSIAVFHGLSRSISEPMMADMRTMPDVWSKVEARRREALMGLRQVLERGKRSGEIRPDLHVDLFLRIYLLMINAVGNPAVILALNMKPSELAGQLGGLFLKGILNDKRRTGGAS
mgnify:FL=1